MAKAQTAKKQVRIPLASAYTSRMSAVGAAANTTAYAGVGVAGLMVAGRTVSATSKDARYVNCFAQTVTDQLTGTKRLWVVKRPGFETNTTPASGSKGYGVFVWSGRGDGTDVISAFGETNSTIYNGTTSLGAMTGRCTGITETIISSTPTLCFTSTNNTGWYYDVSVGTLTEITDAQWPGDTETIVGTFAHLDGFPCVMTQEGNLWAGDLNTITGWTANSFSATNARPDKGIGCVRYKNFIMAFSTDSCEFWYNAGLSPFPLARATALTIQVGAVSADAIGEISDNKFWVGATPQGGLSVFQYDGSLSRISNPEQDSALALAGPGNISLTTIRFYGRSFVLVNTGSTTTHVYCIEEKMWGEWNATTILWKKCAGVSKGQTIVNYAVSDDATSGKVYRMNNASLVFTDDSTAYTARAQTSPVDLGTHKKKFWESVEVVGDTESSASNITLLYTDDDYVTYTTWGTIDLSTAFRKVSRLGASKRRAWAITHAANTPMRIEALEVVAEIGAQ